MITQGKLQNIGSGSIFFFIWQKYQDNKSKIKQIEFNKSYKCLYTKEYYQHSKKVIHEMGKNICR